MALTLLITGLVCGCCFLIFLLLVVLSVIARVLGLGRKRVESVSAEVQSEERGPVMDAEFKDIDEQGEER
jgi:hypothetical protein